MQSNITLARNNSIMQPNSKVKERFNTLQKSLKTRQKRSTTSNNVTRSTPNTNNPLKSQPVVPLKPSTSTTSSTNSNIIPDGQVELEEELPSDEKAYQVEIIRQKREYQTIFDYFARQYGREYPATLAAEKGLTYTTLLIESFKKGVRDTIQEEINKAKLELEAAEKKIPATQRDDYYKRKKVKPPEQPTTPSNDNFKNAGQAFKPNSLSGASQSEIETQKKGFKQTNNTIASPGTIPIYKTSEENIKDYEKYKQYYLNEIKRLEGAPSDNFSLITAKRAVEFYDLLIDLEKTKEKYSESELKERKLIVDQARELFNESKKKSNLETGYVKKDIAKYEKIMEQKKQKESGSTSSVFSMFSSTPATPLPSLSQKILDEEFNKSSKEKHSDFYKRVGNLIKTSIGKNTTDTTLREYVLQLQCLHKNLTGNYYKFDEREVAMRYIRPAEITVNEDTVITIEDILDILTPSTPAVGVAKGSSEMRPRLNGDPTV
jgi:hypothetical protein